MNVFDENFQLSSTLGAENGAGHGSYLYSVLSSLIHVVKNCQQRLDDVDGTFDERVARMESVANRAEARVNAQSTTIREEVRAAEERVMHAMNRRIDLVTEGLEKTMTSHQDAIKATAALDASLAIATKRIDALAQAFDPSARSIVQLKDDMDSCKTASREALEAATNADTAVKKIDASHSTALRTLHNAVNQRFGGVEDAAQRQAQLFREMLLTQADAIARQTSDVRGAVQRAVGSLETAHGDLASRVNSDLCAMRDAMTDGFEALSKDLTTARSDARDAVGSVGRRVDACEERLDSLRQSQSHGFNDLEMALRNMRSDADDAASTARETASKVSSLQTQHEALRVAQREAAEDSRAADSRANALNELIRDLKSEMKESDSAAARRLDVCEEQLSGAKNATAAIESTADALRERLAALRGDTESGLGVLRDGLAKIEDRVAGVSERVDPLETAIDRVLGEVGMRQGRDGRVVREDDDEDPLHLRVSALSEVSELAAQRIADLVDAFRTSQEERKEREARGRRRRHGYSQGLDSEDDEADLALQRERMDAMMRAMTTTVEAKTALMTTTVADVAARVAAWLDMTQAEGARDGTSVLIERVADLEAMRSKVDRIRDLERRLVGVERLDSRVTTVEGDLDALDGAVRLLNQLAGGLKSQLQGLGSDVEMLQTRGGGRFSSTHGRARTRGPRGYDTTVRSPSDSLR